MLVRATPAVRAHAIGTDADPVLLEVFNNLFMAIAEQMGVTLANTSYSVNIKERLDFSCALFDAAGNLIANAPHMPVHLGSMGESVRTVIDARRKKMRPGDVFVLNAPYNGGTHLPDVTVIAPVFLDASLDDRPRAPSAPARRIRAASRVLRGGARPPCRHRRHHAGLDAARFDARRRGGRAARQRAARRRGPLSRGRDARAARRRPPSVAQHRAESCRPAGAGRGVRERRRRAPPDGGAFRPGDRAGLHAARAGQCRGIRAARARRADRRAIRSRDGQRRAHRGRDLDRPGEPERHHRLHRDQSAAGDQLQRAVRRVQGRGALRLPDAGRRRDPDERRLHEAAVDRHPGRVDAGAALARGGGRRQCGDVAGDHRCALRRARRDGGLPGNDEQLHVR